MLPDLLSVNNLALLRRGHDYVGRKGVRRGWTPAFPLVKFADPTANKFFRVSVEDEDTVLVNDGFLKVFFQFEVGVDGSYNTLFTSDQSISPTTINGVAANDRIYLDIELNPDDPDPGGSQTFLQMWTLTDGTALLTTKTYTDSNTDTVDVPFSTGGASDIAAELLRYTAISINNASYTALDTPPADSRTHIYYPIADVIAVGSSIDIEQLHDGILNVTLLGDRYGRAIGD